MKIIIWKLDLWLTSIILVTQKAESQRKIMV
jgi:hypothetical protein